MIADVIGIAQASEVFLAGALVGVARQSDNGDSTSRSLPPTCRLSDSHLSREGHAGSPGRARRMSEPVRSAAFKIAGAPASAGTAAASPRKSLLFKFAISGLPPCCTILELTPGLNCYL